MVELEGEFYGGWFPLCLIPLWNKTGVPVIGCFAFFTYSTFFLGDLCDLHPYDLTEILKAFSLL
jgi:hypothetical protein